MKLNNETLLIGGLALVAGAFVFKDQICKAVPGIPLLCDTGNGPDPAIQKVVDDCAKKCPGGVLNKNCMGQCSEATLTAGYNANYAGYY